MCGACTEIFSRSIPRGNLVRHGNPIQARRRRAVSKNACERTPRTKLRAHSICGALKPLGCGNGFSLRKVSPSAFEIAEETLARATAASRSASGGRVCVDRNSTYQQHGGVDFEDRHQPPRRFADVFHERGRAHSRDCSTACAVSSKFCGGLSEGKRVEWADFALSSGYYDQPTLHPRFSGIFRVESVVLHTARTRLHQPRSAFRLTISVFYNTPRARSATMKGMKYKPDGYHSVTPYLKVRGAAAMFDFYARAFGAKELMRFAAPGWNAPDALRSFDR